MPVMTSYRPGSFCWADLATNDPDGAKSFYAELFGWEPIDLATPARVPYTVFLKGGRQVCALYRVWPGQEVGPPRWQSYVAVDDAGAVATQALAHGGSVLMPPMDVVDAGRMAMIQDPTGAVLGLWERNRHFGAELWNAPGSICWNELLTHEPDRAEQFLGQLFGWETRTSQSLMDGKYRIITNSGAQVGGMLRIEPEWGDMPANWTLYFGVDSCDGTITETLKLGGGLLFPAMEIENVGRFVYLQDPQGAVFAIIQQAHPA